jgi:hypothetical protein
VSRRFTPAPLGAENWSKIASPGSAWLMVSRHQLLPIIITTFFFVVTTEHIIHPILLAMTGQHEQWNMKYEQLVEFKRKKGHCMVPRSYEQNKSLGNWVHTQRTFHNNNKLGIDRKIILDEIGFTWKPDGDHNFKQDDKLWHQQYENVVEFKRIYGHCMVPKTYEKDKSLGQWVNRQRTYHTNNKLRRDREELLDEIGFAWKADTSHSIKPGGKLWHQHYGKLLEHKRINGHCKVPSKYKDDKSLAQWVIYQRARHANNKMPPDQEELLDALDFVWKCDTVATRSSTTDVSCLAISSSHAFGRSCFSLLSSILSTYLFRIRIRKRSQAVLDSQMKH